MCLERDFLQVLTGYDNCYDLTKTRHGSGDDSIKNCVKCHDKDDTLPYMSLKQ